MTYWLWPDEARLRLDHKRAIVKQILDQHMPEKCCIGAGYALLPVRPKKRPASPRLYSRADPEKPTAHRRIDNESAVNTGISCSSSLLTLLWICLGSCCCGVVLFGVAKILSILRGLCLSTLSMTLYAASRYSLRTQIAHFRHFSISVAISSVMEVRRGKSSSKLLLPSCRRIWIFTDHGHACALPSRTAGHCL